MIKTPEQLDELINAVKNGAALPQAKDPADTGMVNLASILANLPKAEFPKADLLRVRNKVLDRISLPAQMSSGSASGFLSYLPRILRIGGAVIGGFMILLSMTIGTAVAALESLPGQPIYPLKKIVENVQLQLADDDEQKANLQIKFANNRVDELETILQRQKQGRISNEQVQRIVASTVKDLEKTAQTVASQNQGQPKVDLLTKIVTLSNKQTAVLEAAQVTSEGEVKIELEKALEQSKTAREQAIENIERVGLIVEDQPLVIEEPPGENEVSAEGKVTAVTSSSLNIGSVQFLLTTDTKYVNINAVDLAVDQTVKIEGETRTDGKTYATTIELLSEPEPEDSDPLQEENTEETPADEPALDSGQTAEPPTQQ